MRLGCLFSFLLLFLLPVTCFSQKSTFKYQLIAGDSTAVQGVVTFQTADSAVLKKMITDSTGYFTQHSLKDGKYILKIEALGYDVHQIAFTIKSGKYQLPQKIVLQQSSNNLESVVVAAKKPAVIVKQDTLEYSASSVKLGEDATTEDIFQKLPGIEVSRNGTIKANGEQITQIYVDGKPYFGADIKAVTQNFPAEMIEKIQVINKKPEGGPDDGSYEKIINITLKKNKKQGFFGNTAAGGGSSKRYDLKTNTNYLHYDTKISLIANTSNSNNGNPDANSPGDLNTRTIKASYATSLKNLDISAWGAMNSSNNKTRQDIYRENYFSDSSTIYNESRFGNNKNKSLSTGVFIEYKPDSFSVIKLNQSAGLSKNAYTSNAGFETIGSDKLYLINKGSSKLNGDNTDKWLNGSLNYNRRIGNNGRNVNLEFVNRLNVNDGVLYSNYDNYYADSSLNILQNRFNDQANYGKNYVVTTSYYEPISTKSSLSFSYGLNYNNNDLPKTIYAYNTSTGLYDSLLNNFSNHFNNTSNSGTASVTYNYHTKKAGFFIGVRWKNAKINSSAFDKDSSYQSGFKGILPNLGFFTTSKKITQNIDYNMYIKAPDALQLQPIIDNTNPLFTRFGNPDLKYSLIQTVKYKLNWYSSKKETGLNAKASFSLLLNNISNSLVYDEASGKQISAPINTNDAYNWNAWCTFYKPIYIGEDKLKWNINLSGSGFSNANLLNGVSNITTYNTMRVLTGFLYDGKSWIDLRTNFSYTKQTNQYSLQENLNVSTDYITINPVITLRPTEKTEINIDYDYRSLKSNDETLNNNINLLNANIRQYVDDKKAIAISLKAFDLLNENNNTTRSFGENYLQDVTSNTLSRYLMLSVSFRLQHFN